MTFHCQIPNVGLELHGMTHNSNIEKGNKIVHVSIGSSKACLIFHLFEMGSVYVKRSWSARRLGVFSGWSSNVIANLISDGKNCANETQDKTSTVENGIVKTGT